MERIRKLTRLFTATVVKGGWNLDAKRISLILGAFLLTAAALHPSAWAVSGAAFTTVDEAADETGHCKNGNPGVNCNIYDGKEFVWLNGGPAANGLGPNGQYFFAVLVPGGQPDPNDGGDKNLSDDFDTYADRTFTVTNGEVSAYSGPHDFDDGVSGSPTLSGTPPFIRLAPYADTTNPGGVYILAICSLANGYPVDPRDCKYDAFKVREGALPPAQQGEIDIFKFCDANVNGILDPGTEAGFGLGGWQINFTPDPNPCSGTTDANGLLACPDLPVDSPGPNYSVSEVVQAGFKHTATCVDGSCGTGTCSVTNATSCTSDAQCPSGEQCIVPSPSSDSASITLTGGDIHFVDFGNVGLSTISGRKFDDRNANGVNNSEPGIAGVKVLLTGTADNGTAVSLCTITDGSGNYSFTSLLPGIYRVSEVKPSGTIATTPTSCLKELALDASCQGTTQTCNFGNVCQGAGGGLTLGFWSNNNGQALITKADLCFLNGLNLRNANGSNFDPVAGCPSPTNPQFSAGKTALKNWLLSATATNMAYMLSAQLAAMELNVLHGFVNGSALIYAPGTTSANSAGFATMNAIMAEANTELGLHPVTIDGGTGSAFRPYQQALKNALDRANNNLNFVVACPATFGATCP